jgi:saccharopine dehydrogenase-like NADP-dependent oxidoreductase|tara:strand:+ start:1916 stop:2167 length:252 start_codon:yes stop_codon:yes gene_type:complete
MSEDFKHLLIDLSEKVEALSLQLKNQNSITEFISENDAVILLGVTKVTLNSWRNDEVLKKGTHYNVFKRTIRYKKNALLNFNN